MAKTKISEFSSTPANNTDIDSINIAEGCAPSGINDAIRELMSQLKDWQSGASNDPYVIGSSGSLTLNQGTANGVLYLNGSKVVTSSSALTFDGTTLVNTGSGDRAKFGTGTRNIYIAGDTGGVSLFDGASQTGNGWYMNGASNYVAGYISSSEQMRLTSTGLGIGTSSPAYKLDVSGTIQATGGGGAKVRLTDNTVSVLNSSATASGYLSFKRSDGTQKAAVGSYYNVADEGNLEFIGPTGSTNMLLNSSGNLGLGVTPSAWASTAIQVGGYASLTTNTSLGAAELSSNAYRSSGSTWNYISSNYASRYRQYDSTHAWFTAASGTAGNAITFTQAMTLTSAGKLLVGFTTAPTADASLFGNGIQSTLTSGGGGFANLPLSGGGQAFYTHTGVAGSESYTERARIDSSGNLLVGTTSTSSYMDGRFTVSAVEQQPAICAKTDPNGGAPSQFVYSAWAPFNSGTNYFMQFETETTATIRGSITYNRGAGLVAYNVTSDYRAKDIYGPVVNSGELIDSVPVYMGKMKGATQERPMFIAHETPVYAHTGEKDAVDENGNPVYQQMDTSALVPVMWAEIQSLRKRLADAGIA